MNKSLLLGLIVLLVSCHSVKLDNTLYKKSQNLTELGTVGKSTCGLSGAKFETKAFPDLQNRIRVAVKVLDFDKKNKAAYQWKIKNDKLQSSQPINDSLSLNKQYAVVSIMDKAGFVQELNASYNRDVRNYLMHANKPKLISSIGVVITADKVQRLAQADACYIKSVKQKNQLVLVNQKGKEMGTIALLSDVILGYKMSKICWATDKRHQWYIADLISEKESCKGVTTSCVKKSKSTKRLYNL